MQRDRLEQQRAAKKGKANSPWSKHPHCTTARAKRIYRECQRTEKPR